MNGTARPTASLLIATSLAAAFLVGCSPQPDPGPGETTPGETSPPAGDPSAQQPCVVGGWSLDVPAYEAESESYLLGLGLPIEGFELTGAGNITFTADGLVATDVDLTSTGTIVAGDTRVPFNEPGHYIASGDWSLGADSTTIDLANWSSDAAPDVLEDPSSPGAPAIDYTGIPSIVVNCSEHELELIVPGAPLRTQWFR